MSDDAAAHFDQAASPETPTPDVPFLTIGIRLYPNGKVDFAFPDAPRTTIYGMLEMARAQYDKLFLLKELAQTHGARGGLNGFVRKLNGRG